MAKKEIVKMVFIIPMGLGQNLRDALRNFNESCCLPVVHGEND